MLIRLTTMSSDLTRDLEKEVDRRRTFAIISHPDAGKTTLTEKLLLYGGAIHLAGHVRAKASQRHTTSDWMEIERQRGISISSSVLQFDYEGTRVNLLDTPGHKDFSEDTYRTLTAADAAVMLIDVAKGVEPQTIKLFEVCRMRGIPIFTFVNKVDRPGRDPLELLDELEKVLGIRSCPMMWPIGSGDMFRGVYDRTASEVLVFETDGTANAKGRLASVPIKDLNDPHLLKILAGPRNDPYEAKELHEKLIQDVELLQIAGDTFDHERVLRGELTPVFFGSALNNFGVERFLQNFIRLAPSPAPRKHTAGTQDPKATQFSGFIFKIQANMDPSHRDRVAFFRVVSGKFTRAMQVKHGRLKKDVKLSMPLNFFGQERVVVEEAWPGDIVGLLDTSGDLRIGDTLSSAPAIVFEGIPQFTPEHFAQVRLLDPMKRKQLQKGLDQLAEEGVVQIYRQQDLGDKDPFVGAVGALQFEVLEARLKAEYNVDSKIERSGYVHCRWVRGEGYNPNEFDRRDDTRALVDRDGLPIVLFKSDWSLRWARDNHKNLEFLATSPMVIGT